MEKTLTVKDEPIQSLSIPDLLAGVIKTGVTAETVVVMKELLAMQERVEARDAEKQFNSAFVKLQTETGKIEATKAVSNSEEKGGGVRYYFAPYEEIMDRVQPLLTKYGFAIDFDSETTDGRLTATCTLSHIAGHSRASRFAVRYTKPPGSSDAQGDMSTLSYAKRGALCNRLNIRIGSMDDNAKDEGDPDEFVTRQQAVELLEWAEALSERGKCDVPKMLAWAKAASFQTIPASKYEGLVSLLQSRDK